MRKLIVGLLFISCFYSANSMNKMENPDKFVQFYISSLENREKANELNEFLKSKDGIKMSRVDATGKVVFVIFKSEYNYTEAEFTTWMNEKGYSFTCFNSGIQGVDTFKKLTPEDCTSNK